MHLAIDLHTDAVHIWVLQCRREADHCASITHIEHQRHACKYEGDVAQRTSMALRSAVSPHLIQSKNACNWTVMPNECDCGVICKPCLPNQPTWLAGPSARRQLHGGVAVQCSTQSRAILGRRPAQHQTFA